MILQIILQFRDRLRVLLLFLQLDRLVIIPRRSLTHHAHRQPIGIHRVQKALFHREKTIFQLETIDIHVIEYHVIPLLAEFIVIPAIHDGNIRIFPEIMLQIRTMIRHDPERTSLIIHVLLEPIHPFFQGIIIIIRFVIPVSTSQPSHQLVKINIVIGMIHGHVTCR